MTGSGQEGAVRRLVLPEDAAGRLDAMLSRLLPRVSRRRLKEAFHEHRVRVDGRPAKGADPARPGAAIELRGLPDAEARAAEADDLPQLTVVHADAALIVVEKPAGVPAYPLRPGETGTVAGAVLARFPDLEGVGDHPLAPGLLHRLDLETSGLLLFARTPAAFARMREAFTRRELEKTYRAVAAGRLDGAGVVEVPLGRPRGHGARMAPAPDAAAHPCAWRHVWPARTHWRALGPVDPARVAPGTPLARATLVELALETGVTHQARLHLAWLGHPIVGDRRYGGPPAPRLWLHAARLSLTHPETGRPATFESPVRLP